MWHQQMIEARTGRNPKSSAGSTLSRLAPRSAGYSAGTGQSEGGGRVSAARPVVGIAQSQSEGGSSEEALEMEELEATRWFQSVLVEAKEQLENWELRQCGNMNHRVEEAHPIQPLVFSQYVPYIFGKSLRLLTSSVRCMP
ncbi:hypothetical protein AXG93_59s1220 [Marchantia polymorpha subsp. ruderalis]|uniref:Uncharacterized protein n=1 Tax=Marchantia polymorpha subsp. ruderalis TaxID=1480154 RepID=A0A176W2J6_MARPO|nr:hypothetical protein AXG93_59s1220 [Marchantia polymorpha subsp. ruderalis]